RRTEDDIQPYVVIEREQIARSQATDLEGFLKTHLSMNTASRSLEQASTDPSNGFGSIDLRGLGSEQTLILVDGRRVPGVALQGNFFQPYIGGIPLSSIERIEVLPSTAGAIYGGGATGGVVNIIRKRDYTGLDLNVQYGNTFESDVASLAVSANGGFSFGEGR